jgi:hypothetical protein
MPAYTSPLWTVTVYCATAVRGFEHRSIIIMQAQVPAPCSTNELATSKKREGGNNQKLMLFRRGNAISGAPIIRGTNMLPNPPISAGIPLTCNLSL